MTFCCRPNSPPSLPGERLPRKQKISFLCGHVLNDLAGSAWFSYVLVFLTKVAGLSNPHAGYVVLAGQIIEAVSSPVIGQLCDRTVSCYGRRKTWHLIGTLGVSITFPMIYMRCIGCEESPSSTKLGYYISLALVFCMSWGSTQIGHLSLIPDICKKASETVELSALRSAVTFICGIFIYVITWVLLGQNKEGSLSPKVWKQFMVRMIEARSAILELQFMLPINVSFRKSVRAKIFNRCLHFSFQRGNQKTYQEKHKIVFYHHKKYSTIGYRSIPEKEDQSRDRGMCLHLRRLLTNHKSIKFTIKILQINGKNIFCCFSDIFLYLQYLGIIIVSVGNFFNLIFHVLTVEPPPTPPARENNNTPCLPNDEDQNRGMLFSFDKFLLV